MPLFSSYFSYVHKNANLSLSKLLFSYKKSSKNNPICHTLGTIMPGRHTRSKRKGSYILSKMVEKDIYTGKKFLDLPVGTVILTKNNTKFEIIFKNNQKQCQYLDFNGEYESSPMTYDEFWAVREDETVIYPHGYDSPLWKVLNGQDIE